MEFEFDEDLAQLRDTVRRLAKEKVAPRARVAGCISSSTHRLPSSVDNGQEI